jgi:UPF0042 nucleotide-binding protein
MTDHPSHAPAAAAALGSVTPQGGGGGAVVIVTGMSGAGKSQALKAFEDLGYETIDNLPLSLLGGVLGGEPGARPQAIGIDIRTRDFGVEPVLKEIDRLVNECGRGIKLLFIDCDDEVLTRRYTETRHRHPLASDRPLLDGIQHERRLILPLRIRADVVLDTSTMPPSVLRHHIEGHFGLQQSGKLLVFVTSFAYRRGLPREADLVFDCRFLRNPHYDPVLRPFTGKDPQVAAYVAEDPDFAAFFGNLTALLAPLLPRFAGEGKSYLTIGVGCTGGRHRSVTVAERLAEWLRQQGQRVDLRHRELEEGGL